MSKFFTYTDSSGVVREAEAFIVEDFSSSRQANSPLKLDSNGYLDGSLFNPAQDMGIKSKTEYITLTNSNLISKKVVLSNIPVSAVSLIPDGAITQRNGIDFVYLESDNSVSWAGLGLEGFLESGETLEISYFYK